MILTIRKDGVIVVFMDNGAARDNLGTAVANIGRLVKPATLLTLKIGTGLVAGRT